MNEAYPISTWLLKFPLDLEGSLYVRSVKCQAKGQVSERGSTPQQPLNILTSFGQTLIFAILHVKSTFALAQRSPTVAERRLFWRWSFVYVIIPRSLYQPEVTIESIQTNQPTTQLFLSASSDFRHQAQISIGITSVCWHFPHCGKKFWTIQKRREIARESCCYLLGEQMNQQELLKLLPIAADL